MGLILSEAQHAVDHDRDPHVEEFFGAELWHELLLTLNLNKFWRKSMFTFGQNATLKTRFFEPLGRSPLVFSTIGGVGAEYVPQDAVLAYRYLNTGVKQ